MRFSPSGLRTGCRSFRVHLDKLDDAADLVIATTWKNYPSLDVPFHARWRHFVSGGVDRYAPLAVHAPDAASRARAAFDLVILSVLLDAGAGAQWCYRDPSSGADIGRSEGLALASLDMFAAGVFSEDPKDRLRADADVLATLGTEVLAHGFQVTANNPLLGLDGRAELIRALGRLVASALPSSR